LHVHAGWIRARLHHAFEVPGNVRQNQLCLWSIVAVKVQDQIPDGREYISRVQQLGFTFQGVPSMAGIRAPRNPSVDRFLRILLRTPGRTTRKRAVGPARYLCIQNIRTAAALGRILMKELSIR